MLKNLNEKLIEPAQEGTRVVMEGVGKLNDAIGDLINTDMASHSSDSSWTPSFILRKLFATASRAVSAGLVGIVGYVIYRSYVSQNSMRGMSSSSSALHLQMLNDIQDPEISRLRKREEIEEVLIFTHFITSLAFVKR